jgi:hypothetical protein
LARPTGGKAGIKKRNNITTLQPKPKPDRWIRENQPVMAACDAFKTGIFPIKGR